MAPDNPWQRWGLVQSRRDGRPVLSETQLWQLLAKHPEAIERAPNGDIYVHLDMRYRVVKLPDRSWMALEPLEPPAR
jgi:hypothetical protein